MALDKKQIALSIGGVIASGAIAYLIYRAEQRNSAVNTAAQVAASQAAEQASQDNSDQQAELLAQLPSLSSGGGGGGGYSGYSDGTDSTPTDSAPAADTESSLLGSILQSLGSTLSTPVSTPAVTIPAYTGEGLDSEPTLVNGIPSQIAPLIINGSSSGGLSINTGSTTRPTLSAPNTYSSNPS